MYILGKEQNIKKCLPHPIESTKTAFSLKVSPSQWVTTNHKGKQSNLTVEKLGRCHLHHVIKVNITSDKTHQHHVSLGRMH